MQRGAFPIHAHLHPFHSHLPPFHSFHAKSPPRLRRKRIAFMLKAENGGHNAWWQPFANHWTIIEQSLNNHWTKPVQTLFNPIKYTRRFVKWNPSFRKTKPRRLGDYKRKVLVSCRCLHCFQPTCDRPAKTFLVCKSTHETTTTKQNQKKEEIKKE